MRAMNLRRRLCDLIGHHHRPTRLDGMLWRRLRKAPHIPACRICHWRGMFCSECGHPCAGTTRNRCGSCYEAHVGTAAHRAFNERRLADLAADRDEARALEDLLDGMAVARDARLSRGY